MSASMTPVLGIGAISIIDKKNVTPQSRWNCPLYPFVRQSLNRTSYPEYLYIQKYNLLWFSWWPQSLLVCRICYPTRRSVWHRYWSSKRLCKNVRSPC
jgi:hypothetical protein